MIMINDDAEFQADIDYLRSIGAALLEHAAGHLPWPSHDTIEEQLIDNLSPAARRAVLNPWPTVAVLTDATIYHHYGQDVA